MLPNQMGDIQPRKNAVLNHFKENMWTNKGHLDFIFGEMKAINADLSC